MLRSLIHLDLSFLQGDKYGSTCIQISSLTGVIECRCFLFFVFLLCICDDFIKHSLGILFPILRRNEVSTRLPSSPFSSVSQIVSWVSKFLG